MQWKSSVSILFLLTCLVLQGETEELSPLVRSVDLELLLQLSEGVGHELKESGFNDSDVPYIQMSSPGGVQYFAYGTACDPSPCKGMQLLALFRVEGRVDLELVNRLNVNMAPVSVWIGRDGQLGVSRYLILDHGQTMENLKLNFSVFADLIENVSRELGSTSAE